MRTVIKIGTSSITYENGKLNLKRIADLARVVSDLKNRGEEVIIVSSGAIGAGMGKLNIEKPTSISKKQAVAAIGQAYLIEMYQRSFSQYNTHVAQVLLTKDVLEHPVKSRNVKATFTELLALEVVPIVNENDTVSTEEIVGEFFSDNDHLSSVVAGLVKADRLIILSNIDGLYKRIDGLITNEVIKEVEDITDVFNNIDQSTSLLGTGGMKSKLEAIQSTVQMGIDAFIINGNNPGYIYDLFDGISRGTFFKGVVK